MMNSKQQHFSIPLQSGLAITDGQNPALPSGMAGDPV